MALSFSARASDSTQLDVQKAGAISEIDPKLEAESTDREFRLDRRIMGTLQPVGFGPIPEFSQGATLGYFLNSNSILQLEYTVARTPFKSPVYAGPDGHGSSTSSKRWYSNLSGNSIGVHLKHFFGNSFYLKGGVDYRILSRRNEYDGSSNDSFSVEFSGESWAAALAVGNQWQFSYFTFGCDWLGVSTPISHRVKSESVNGPATEAGLSLQKDDESRYLSQSSLQLLRIYGGLSF